MVASRGKAMSNGRRPYLSAIFCTYDDDRNATLRQPLLSGLHGIHLQAIPSNVARAAMTLAVNAPTLGLSHSGSPA